MTKRATRNPHPTLTPTRALGLLRSIDHERMRPRDVSSIWHVADEVANALHQHVLAALWRGRQRRRVRRKGGAS